MKIVIQTLAILVMLSFTTSDTNTTSTPPETYTLINAVTSDLPAVTKPGCESRCGDLIVPYPFGIGIGSNCSLGHGFDVYCDTTFNPPKGFLTKTSYASIKVISDSTLRTSNLVASECYSEDNQVLNSSRILTDYTIGPFTLSIENKFIVVGCNDYSWLTSSRKSKNVSTGCMVFCSNNLNEKDALSNECAGNGCCQSPIPHDSDYYTAELGSLRNSNNMSTFLERCTYAFVGEESAFKFKGTSDIKDANFSARIEDTVPVVLEWAIGNMSCVEAKKSTDYVCQSNSSCVSSTRESGGYRCACKEGYEGNPYLFPGCRDIDECKNPEQYACNGDCFNTPGNYTCKCKKGYSGDGKVTNGCQHKSSRTLLLFSLGIGLAFLVLLIIGLSVLYVMANKRKLVKQKRKFYEQNGGALLLDKLKTKGGVGMGSTKIFRVHELEEATDNFAEGKILGKGGYGTVYKGTLPDKRVVAIKKSQRVDEGQREEFINEMIILTQINHTNVVQLLGLCLENDVPLLAYEYVSNDTLYHHIQYRKSGARRLSWDSRLKIAHESAGALAYLHTDARMSIIHRDVKSTNILLDENYTAKIADFGASRLVPLGHDEVVTLVQGTFGYLDPEYLHTGQLTDKSDVYSFGVVLAELLTGQPPLNNERDLKERILATYFVKAVEEDRFLDILERGVVNEATYEQLKTISSLACRCLNLVGGKRPSMKEVTAELESLRRYGPHSLISVDSYNETSSLMIEMEPTDLSIVPLMANIDTFGDSSITTEMQNMMFPSQSAR